MPKFEVIGEYGPQGDQCITLDIEADNEGHAKNIFCERMESEYPHEWSRMGRHNVQYVARIDELEKPVTEIVQTLWRVKFSSRSDMIVTAANLLDVARHVDGYCKDTGTSPKDLIKIEYLAY